MAADQDIRTRRTTDDGAAPGTHETPASRTPSEPPPQAVMGLLNYITATSLDEDYAAASQRRGATAPGRATPGKVALVVLAVFGTLVATAAVQTARNAEESQRSRDALVTQVNSRRDRLDDQRAEIATLHRQISALQDDNLDATTQGRAVRARLDRLGVATGAVATRGPGIRVVVDDAPGATTAKEQVLDQDLQKLVNALWLVGAEAVSVNGQRVTNLTALRQAGNAITANFVSLRRPYTVSAIGNRNQMSARLLETDGGKLWLTLRSNVGLRFDINTEDSMTLPAAETPTLRNARQPERLR